MYSKLVPSWRRPYRLAKGDAGAGVVAAEAEKALSATLRRTGGCPGIQELGRIVADAVRSDDQSWRGRADEVVRASGGIKHTRMAREVAEGVVEAQGAHLAGLSTEAIVEEFAVAVLRKMVLHYGFGPIQPALIAERFGSPSGVIAFEAECLAQMRLRPIAAKLLAGPRAERLRAPSTRPRKKRSMASMLEVWP